MPVPVFVTLPTPLMLPAKAVPLARLKTSVAWLVTSPVMLPLLPPLPICKVPALTVVPPV
ncbi:hypothetical protein D3C71_1178100 [compost metagenome]